MDYSPPGSSVHGILQARILEGVAIFFSRGSSRPSDRTCISFIGRQIFFFLPLSYQEAPKMSLNRESCPVVSDSLQLHGLYSPWNSPGQNTGGDFPTQGSNPGWPTLQMESLPAEPPGKPKNTGVDSLTLLQWIFVTQELNQNLLHCRQILYQLSY